MYGLVGLMFNRYCWSPFMTLQTSVNFTFIGLVGLVVLGARVLQYTLCVVMIDIRILRYIEQYYSTQIYEMPVMELSIF